jgi:phospholipid-binding lipoprotein MlaA
MRHSLSLTPRLAGYCHKLALVLLLAVMGAGAQAQEDDDDFFIFDEEEDDSPSIADPFESLNRASFAFNDTLYRGVLKPVARGLRVIPRPVRTSGANFFDNLFTPVSAVNALLQFDLPNTGTEVSRFLINSTIGLFGFFDPATDLGIARDTEDLGQTLGRYGLGHGFYLVVPFFGNSSLRDGLGSFGNAAMQPLYDNLVTGEILAINAVNAEITLSLDQDTYEAFYDSALDPYIFFRSAYVQNRAGRVEQ